MHGQYQLTAALQTAVPFLNYGVSQSAARRLVCVHTTHNNVPAHACRGPPNQNCRRGPCSSAALVLYTTHTTNVPTWRPFVVDPQESGPSDLKVHLNSILPLDIPILETPCRLVPPWASPFGSSALPGAQPFNPFGLLTPRSILLHFCPSALLAPATGQ